MAPRDATSRLGREIAAGATVLAPDGRDVTSAVRQTFARLLPLCSGNEGEAAAQAVRTALAGEARS